MFILKKQKKFTYILGKKGSPSKYNLLHPLTMLKILNISDISWAFYIKTLSNTKFFNKSQQTVLGAATKIFAFPNAFSSIFGITFSVLKPKLVS